MPSLLTHGTLTWFILRVDECKCTDWDSLLSNFGEGMGDVIFNLNSRMRLEEGFRDRVEPIPDYLQNIRSLFKFFQPPIYILDQLKLIPT